MTYVPRISTCTCPTCGQSLPAAPDLRVDLDANVLICAGRSFELQARQAELLWFLLARYPGSATTDAVVSNVWANVDVLLNTVRCTVSRVRCLLESVGWSIKAERGIGYRLIPLAPSILVREHDRDDRLGVVPGMAEGLERDEAMSLAGQV